MTVAEVRCILLNRPVRAAECQMMVLSPLHSPALTALGMTSILKAWWCRCNFGD